MSISISVVTVIFALGAVVCAAAESQPSSKPANQDRSTVLWEGLACGSTSPWQVTRGRVVASDQDRNVCCLLSDKSGARTDLSLPGRHLARQRVRVEFRYRLGRAEASAKAPSAYLQADWKVAKGKLAGLAGYHRTEIEPTGRPDQWGDFHTTIDFSSSVRDAVIQLSLKTPSARMEIANMKLIATPQFFSPIGNAPRARRGKLLFEDNFDGDLANWVHEGAGTAEIKGGRLHVHVTEDMSERRGQILWLTRKLPSDVIVEMRVNPTAPTNEKPRPANLLYFLSATSVGGDLLGTTDKRKGIYRKYTAANADVPCYTVTWYRVNDPYFLIARRNPGWKDLGRSFTPIPTAGKDHELVIEKVGGRILVVEDGICSLSVKDTGQKPLEGGYFGLRAWHAEANYDYVKIYEALDG